MSRPGRFSSGCALIALCFWCGAPPLARAEEIADALSAAQQHETAGRFPQAITAYERILSTHPDQMEARLGLGTSLAGAKRFEEAIGAFKEVLARDPANARAHLLLGDIYLYHVQQYDLALAAFEQAASMGDPRTKGLAMEQAGDILMMAKHDWAQAAERYRRVLATWPNHIKTHYNLGGCLANQGELEAAVAEMELVIKLAPKAEAPEMATRAREAIAAIRAKQAAAGAPPTTATP